MERGRRAGKLKTTKSSVITNFEHNAYLKLERVYITGPLKGINTIRYLKLRENGKRKTRGQN